MGDQVNIKFYANRHKKWNWLAWSRAMDWTL